jgi:hypothetical protein
MPSRWWALGLVSGCLLAGCNGSDQQPESHGPAPTVAATASAACLTYDGPPDGSAKHPYLKRAMALDCREDVKRLQTALGITADGHFDNDTATAVIRRQAAYDCIKADDGQVGPQTWSLIVDGVDPCTPRTGSKTPEAMPTWARCIDGDTTWGLRTEDRTTLRRCGKTLELVYDGKTLTSPVQDLGSSACGEFEESFSAPSGTSTICVSNPATDEQLEASLTADPNGSVYQNEVKDRYVKQS